MNETVRKALASVIQAQQHPDFVFTNKIRQMIDPDHFSSREFLRALKKAEVRKLNFHCTRHSYASHFMMNGGNIYTLQKLLGHSDIKSTMIYAHLSPSHFAEASQIVNFESVQTLKPVINESVIEKSSPYLALA